MIEHENQEIKDNYDDTSGFDSEIQENKMLID